MIDGLGGSGRVNNMLLTVNIASSSKQFPAFGMMGCDKRRSSSKSLCQGSVYTGNEVGFKIHLHFRVVFNGT